MNYAKMAADPDFDVDVVKAANAPVLALRQEKEREKEVLEAQKARHDDAAEIEEQLIEYCQKIAVNIDSVTDFDGKREVLAAFDVMVSGTKDEVKITANINPECIDSIQNATTIARTWASRENRSFSLIIRPLTAISKLTRKPARPKRWKKINGNIPVGTRIEEKRLALGLDVRELARLLGVQSGALSMWEQEAKQPRGYHMRLIYRWLRGVAEFNVAHPASFGERMRQVRKERHVSQAELAGYLSVSKMSVSQWESGKRTPSRLHKERLLDWLGEEIAREMTGNVDDQNFTDNSDEENSTPDVPLTEFGIRIRQKRKEWGMTQEQLGEYLGLSRMSIYQWERGVNTPSYPSYELVCDWLAMDITSRIDRGDSDDWQSESQ